MVSSGLIAAIIVTAVILLLVIFFLMASVKIVRHSEVMIIERFGKYKRTLKPGLHFITPIIEIPRKIDWRYLKASSSLSDGDSQGQIMAITTERIDMREHVIELGRQHVITKDTVQIDIDALVYFRITDPRLAIFKIQNLPDAVELLTQATLRNIIAQMSLDDTFSSRDHINHILLNVIQRDAERWGVAVTGVEIFNILPPNDIKRAMEQQIRAERERRSEVLQADGERESAIIRSRGTAARIILMAEGRRGADLLRAKGIADAKMLLAKAEARCVEAVKEVIQDGERAVDYLTAVQYLNTLQAMSLQGDSKVVLMPVETVEGIQSLTASA